MFEFRELPPGRILQNSQIILSGLTETHECTLYLCPGAKFVYERRNLKTNDVKRYEAALSEVMQKWENEVIANAVLSNPHR